MLNAINYQTNSFFDIRITGMKPNTIDTIIPMSNINSKELVELSQIQDKYNNAILINDSEKINKLDQQYIEITGRSALPRRINNHIIDIMI